MQNLKNIEGNYNVHLNAFERAFVNKKIIAWRTNSCKQWG